MTSPLLANFRSGPALLAFALTAVIGLFLDLWTKREAFDRLAPWGIEQVDESSPRQGALQVVPKRSLPVGGSRLLGIVVAQAASPSGPPVIAEISPMTPAADAVPVGSTTERTRILPGDQLISVNGSPVTNEASLDRLLIEASKATNEWFEHPAPAREWEWSTPPAPKGIDLKVVRRGVELTYRIRAFEEPIVHPFIKDGLHFQALVNQGAVFGIGQGQRWLFLIVSCLAVAFILYLFATSGNHRFYQFVLGLLLAGVIGNMYDRTLLGFVRDMLHALPGQTWPGSNREIFPWIFNLADTWLCVGVGLVFLYTLRGSPATRDRKDEPPGIKGEDSKQSETVSR